MERPHVRTGAAQTSYTHYALYDDDEECGDRNTPQKLADHCALGAGYYVETLPWEIRAGHLEANPLSLVF